MEKITLTCLKILVDSRLVKETSDDFRILTVKFIKNVVMQEEVHKQRLMALHAAMSPYESEKFTHFFGMVPDLWSK